MHARVRVGDRNSWCSGNLVRNCEIHKMFIYGTCTMCIRMQKAAMLNGW